MRERQEEIERRLVLINAQFHRNGDLPVSSRCSGNVCGDIISKIERAIRPLGHRATNAGGVQRTAIHGGTMSSKTRNEQRGLCDVFTFREPQHVHISHLIRQGWV